MGGGALGQNFPLFLDFGGFEFMNSRDFVSIS